MEFNLSNEQASRIANAIYNNNFRVFGIGNFDVSRSEFVEILIGSFGRNREKKCSDLYEKYCERKMR